MGYDNVFGIGLHTLAGPTPENLLSFDSILTAGEGSFAGGNRSGIFFTGLSISP